MGCGVHSKPKTKRATQTVAEGYSRCICHWLGDQKPDWGSRFAAAFIAVGIEDTTDLQEASEPTIQELMCTLEGAEAKSHHLDRLRTAMTQVRYTYIHISVRRKSVSESLRDTLSEASITAESSSGTATWMAKNSVETKRFGAFLSHHKGDCAMEARYVKEMLRPMLPEGSQHIFLDSDDLHNRADLISHVKASRALLVLLSANIFTKPWCLVELYTAIEASVPVVALNIFGKGYDHKASCHLLTYLDTELDRCNPGACDLIHDAGLDLLDVTYKLSNTVPNIISVPFVGSESQRNIRASLCAALEVLQTAKHLTPSKTKEQWLASRDERQQLTMPLSQQGSSCPPHLHCVNQEE